MRWRAGNSPSWTTTSRLCGDTGVLCVGAVVCCHGDCGGVCMQTPQDQRQECPVP